MGVNEHAQIDIIFNKRGTHNCDKGRSGIVVKQFPRWNEFFRILLWQKMQELCATSNNICRPGEE